MRIKKGDTVLVTTGKNKGTKGKVLEVFPDTMRVTVEKVNVAKKHVKKTREQAGQRIEKEIPIHVSNVMLISPETGKPTRVRYEVPKQGKKYRVAVRGGGNLERPFVKS